MPVFSEVKKGYDPKEVNDFIKQQNDASEAKIKEQEDRIRELENEVKRLSKNGVESSGSNEDVSEAKAKYEKLCTDMGEKLLLAEVKASEVIEEATKKGERIFADARINANIEVERILGEANAAFEDVKKAIEEFKAKEEQIRAVMLTVEKTFEDSLAAISKHVYKD